MATSKLYLDTRSQLADGTYPLKLGVSYKKLRTLIPLNIRLTEKQFNGTSVISHPQKDFYNTFIKRRIVDIEAAVLELSTSGKLRYATASSMKRMILDKVAPLEKEPTIPYLFTDCLDKKIMGLKPRTVELYRNTLAKVETFCASKKTSVNLLSLLDINKDWLINFEIWLSKKGDATNTIAIDMRNIRAIYNHAKCNEPDLILAYPFHAYQIKSEQTPFLTLSLDQLALLYHYPCEESDRIYIDVFFLLYYLIGINIGDLCMATKANYHDNRLYYKRNKTSKLYSILVLPEAQDLINIYRDNNPNSPLLLHLHDCKRYEHFTQVMNKHLNKICANVEKQLIRKWEDTGKIGEQPTFPRISTYWARYSWVNIAHRLRISKDIISMALGHSFGNKVTDIYIDYDLDQIDEANRQVIRETLAYIKKNTPK